MRAAFDPCSLDRGSADGLAQATSALFDRHHGELTTCLASFEDIALNAALRVPPGLALPSDLVQPPVRSRTRWINCHHHPSQLVPCGWKLMLSLSMFARKEQQRSN